MRKDLKLIAAAVWLALPYFAHAGPVPCDAQSYVMSKRVEPFAWSSAPSAAAFAWATSKPHDCPCGDTCPCADCQCGKTDAVANPRGLYWSLQLSGEYRLMEPGRCPLGMPCKDKQIGGWNGEYRPWDGYRWGPVTTPPIAPPVSLETAAAWITAGLIGLVSDDDICPGPNCPSCPQGRAAASFSGGGTFVTAEGGSGAAFSVAEHRRRLFRRLLGAPFRAFRAARARARLVSAPAPASITTYALAPVATYTLQPVTEKREFTTFKYLPKAPEMPAKK